MNVMLIDLLLACLHHLLVFALIAMLVAESILLRGPIDAAVLRRLAGIDGGYGLSAGLLLVVGLLRVFKGVKGVEFYHHNPWFHAKLGLFLLVGILSIWPTLYVLRWRKALKSDPNFLPPPSQMLTLRRIVRFELLLIAAILICAAAMARYGFF